MTTDVDINFVPTSKEDLARCMLSPIWRICNLYKVVDKDNQVVVFKPNDAQMKVIRRLWYRNIIPKARQRGISTVIQIVMLDAALFEDNKTCAVIAHTDKVAKKVFTKIKFAYDNLAPEIKSLRPLENDRADMLRFSNGSSVTVSTGFRGDTLQFLHISEFGKICAKYPERAKEIVTGTLPALALNGIGVIESTAEGREGAFYDYVTLAHNRQLAKQPLTKRDYRLFFFSWWDADEYQIDDDVVITDEQHKYFDEVERLIGRPIEFSRRAWYVKTLETEYRGDTALMKQEYPSTIEECFSISAEGAYYKKEMALMRKQGRIVDRIIPIPSIPCETFWDIGNSDGTAIWVRQDVGQEIRLIKFFEMWNEPYSTAVKWLQGTGLIFSRHWLPHDADHVRQGEHTNKSPKQMLETLMPGHKFEIVERIPNIIWGINQTRDIFTRLWISEEDCKEGINHVDLYSKKWDNARQMWREDEPEKYTGHSEACFVAGTMVSTRNGLVPIEQIRAGDYVVTPRGFAEVYGAMPTRMASRFVQITTASGATITCTPSHKIFTSRGLIAANSIEEGDIILTNTSFLWRFVPYGFRQAFLCLCTFRSAVKSILCWQRNG